MKAALTRLEKFPSVGARRSSMGSSWPLCAKRCCKVQPSTVLAPSFGPSSACARSLRARMACGSAKYMSGASLGRWA